jgi:hypothetical protein
VRQAPAAPATGDWYAWLQPRLRLATGTRGSSRACDWRPVRVAPAAPATGDWYACDGSANLMARMGLNNRMVLRTNRMQAIGPAYQAQNHKNCWRDWYAWLQPRLRLATGTHAMGLQTLWLAWV